MQEVFDPPEMERETETKIGTGTSIRKEPDLGSSYQLWGNMKFEEDRQLLSQAKRDLSRVDYQARPAESNYVTDLRSHAYSEDPLPLGREYRRQKSYLPTSSCSWEKSFAFEATPSSPDALGHALGKMRTKTNNLSAGPDYLGSYPSNNAPHMRKHLGEVEFDSGLDNSEHCYRRSGRFTAFSSRNGQSVEHCNELNFFLYGNISSWPTPTCLGLKASMLLERFHHDKFSLKQMVDYARGPRYRDDINPFSRQWCFDDGGPLLPRGLQYGDEIPSLSSKKYNRAPSRSGQWHYGPQTPLFSRRYEYGDEIPSLSRNWRYRDKIPLQSGHWFHDAEAHAPSRYRQGASHRNGHSRQFFAKVNSNEQAKVTASKHAFIKPRMVNRVASSSDHYRTSMKDNRYRNPEEIMDQVRGPRANKLNNTSASSPVKDIISPLVCRDQFNRSDFSVQYKQAKFFMIKSYSEDDIHKGIKYNVWASTANGNNKLDAAYHDAQILMKENGEKCPVFLFFSVNTSGQFVGLAEMLGPVDFKKTMDFWREDKWNGFFPIIWHIIKDIPNRLFRHIILEYNDHRPVTFSRDTQEIGLLQGVQMLKIFKDHPQGTSILDDFDFYEEKDNARRAQKRENSESTNQSGFPEDLEPMGSLEGSMESWSLYDKWD